MADALDSFYFSNLIVTNANAIAVSGVVNGTSNRCRYTVPKTAGVTTCDTIYVSGIAGATGTARNMISLPSARRHKARTNGGRSTSSVI